MIIFVVSEPDKIKDSNERITGRKKILTKCPHSGTN